MICFFVWTSSSSSSAKPGADFGVLGAEIGKFGAAGGHLGAAAGPLGGPLGGTLSAEALEKCRAAGREGGPLGKAWGCLGGRHS